MMGTYINRIIPYASLLVSSTALIFQITVLNPWHKQISNQINDLCKQINNDRK